MTKLQELYEQREQLQAKKVTGYASAVKRHHEIAKLQKEIDYFEQGDSISRARVQEDLNEIETLQQEINRLTIQVGEKKRKLMVNVFGEYFSF